MMASGFAGLGYQIVWTQQCALWLGHEAPAMLAVVAAFFGGIAVGASLLGPRIERSARPERWYAALELTIAGWGVVLAVLLGPVSEAMLALTGPQPAAAWQWGVAFAGTFLLLLPATAAMGATLPAMNRLLSSITHDRQAIAGLYASNTFGAVLGVLACAFWLIPELGLVRSAAICVAFNVTCACAVLLLRPDGRTGPVTASAPAAPAAARRTLALLACTGLLGIGYEVLVVRVLSQVTEDTVYTFALLLVVYLLGTAAGAAAYQRWLADARAGSDRVRARLLSLQAIACPVGTATLWGAESIRSTAAGLAGGGMGGALAAEASLAIAAFLLPTLAMGALFSHLAVQARAQGASLGRVLGFNTAGAMLAPLLVGVLLAPAFGPKACLLLVGAGYLALALTHARRLPLAWASVAVLIVLALATPPLAFVDVPEGGRVVNYRDGTLAAVSVVEDGQGISRLRINNRQQEGSSATRLADARQAFLPLLLHPAPRHALFLGLGTGVTAAAAAQDRSLQVDVVELLPEVIDASALFREPGQDEPLHVMTADARRYVKTAARAYDVIVADNFHPARSGSGALYTVEHFDAIRRRLADQGVFCQWLPLHQLDLATLRSIVRSFVAVYPHGAALLATNSLETPVLGLVARNGAGPFDRSALRGRLAGLSPARPLADYGLADDFAVFGSLVAGPHALKRFAGDAPINTDDRPVVAYRAPRITYAPDSMPRDRLLALLAEFSAQPIELAGLLDTQGDAAWSQRLANYWAARDRFLEAGRDVRASGDIRRMLARVRDPLLAVLQISPDFRPAYDPLLRMAMELARSEPAQSRALLAELARIQPARPEAAQWLDRLGDQAR